MPENSPALARWAAALAPVAYVGAADEAAALELCRPLSPYDVETWETPDPGMPTVEVRRPEL